jgi:hypothetical protein
MLVELLVDHFSSDWYLYITGDWDVLINLGIASVVLRHVAPHGRRPELDPRPDLDPRPRLDPRPDLDPRPGLEPVGLRAGHDWSSELRGVDS